MVDVSNKIKTLRYAKAEAFIKVGEKSLQAIKNDNVPKGNVFEIARVAGIMAAKRTGEIIPLCHNIPLLYCNIDFEILEGGIKVISEVKAIHQTGVEMEALSAVSVAALTVYDMLKPLEEDIEISNIRLVEKRGGKSDFYDKLENVEAAVITVSDSVYAGEKEDESGKLILEKLEEEGVEIVGYKVIPDEPEMIKGVLKEFVEKGVDLVLTTGGTGFSQRDFTPEATKEIITREVPGIPEFMRFYGYERLPYSMLSRSVAGIVNKTLIINLPGSKGGVKDALNLLFPYIFHAIRVIRLNGGGHVKGE